MIKAAYSKPLLFCKNPLAQTRYCEQVPCQWSLLGVTSFLSSMISSDAIKSFQELYLQEYGEEISDEEAIQLGINLLTLMNRIYRPVKKEWLNQDYEK